MGRWAFLLAAIAALLMPCHAETFGTCTYPPAAAGAVGGTGIRFVGNEDGTVSSVRVVAPSGNFELDRAALTCASQWRFDPKSADGASHMGQQSGTIGWTAPPHEPGGTFTAGIAHDCSAYYPAELQKRGVGGTTILVFRITEYGKVDSTEVVTSSGSVELDRAALQCASQWRYRPAVRNGKAVATEGWKAAIVWKSALHRMPAFSEPPRDCVKSYPATPDDLAKLKGPTTLSFKIVKGVVTDVSIERSSGNSEMDRAAAACVATWRYEREDTIKDGELVDRYNSIDVTVSIRWSEPASH